MLVSGAVAFAVVSLLAEGGNRRSLTVNSAPATVSSAPAWLGADTTNSPLGGGAMIADVVPGSPAEAAGLQPGDVITQVDNAPVASPDDVASALAGMHAGQRLQISYARGPLTYTTQVTLAARPPNYP
jgi:S1-C subfamily serine protease